MSSNTETGTEDLIPYQVHSRREIISLLRAMHEQGQLVSMQGGGDSVVTSVLDVDEESGLVVIDRAPSNLANQRIVDSDNISFETVLDNIRILFYSDKVGECLYEERPALYTPIPTRMARLQRREHYRVATPIATPLRCTIQLPSDAGGIAKTVVLTVKDISGGGISLVDENKLLDNTIGRVYKNCLIELPGSGSLGCSLEISNSHDLTLSNGKNIRKLGCTFVSLSHAMEAAVQRYITKLERERNAKATGLK